MATRFWIGMWSTFLLLLIVMFDLSAWVKYITRFTEESFAALIAIIFIVEAFMQLFEILEHAPLEVNPIHEHSITKLCYCALNNANITIGLPTSDSTAEIGTAYKYINSSWIDIDEIQCKSIGGQYIGHDCAESKFVPDVFLLSVIIFTVTFLIAIQLKNIKSTGFFPNKVFQILL